MAKLKEGEKEVFCNFAIFLVSYFLFFSRVFERGKAVRKFKRIYVDRLNSLIPSILTSRTLSGAVSSKNILHSAGRKERGGHDSKHRSILSDMSRSMHSCSRAINWNTIYLHCIQKIYSFVLFIMQVNNEVEWFKMVLSHNWIHVYSMTNNLDFI